MPTCLTPPRNELTWLTLISLQLELDDPTLEHDVLDKVDLFRCANQDPKDKQEVRKILSDYVDVFAKDNINLGQTSLIKHKITLKEGAKPIKENIGEFHQGCMMRCENTSKKSLTLGLFAHQTVPGLALSFW